MACLLLYTAVACDAEPGALAPHAETPAQQWLLHQMRFEERRDGKVVWTGDSQHAAGELSLCRAQQITLRRQPQSSSQAALTVRAPWGDLRFAQGRASFAAPVVSHGAGAKLYAKWATYDESTQALQAEGPVAVWTPSCVAYAQRCTLYLGDSRLEAEGPVHGVFSALPRPP